MHPAFDRVDHRPWPSPTKAWTWRQSWRDLLFAHWPIDAALLRPLIPASLQVDQFDGTAWIGLVPFRMAGVMRRPLPDLPWVSAFPEVNVRTYVRYQGKPGVWFFSLDATNQLAVWAARRWFHLPYFRASMSLRAEGEAIEYRSARPGQQARLNCCYAPAGDVYESQPGSLEHFLTERYCLYAESPDGALYRGDVHHVPWPLQAATAEFREEQLFAASGLAVEGPPALLHFARRIDVAVWSPTRVG